MAQVAPKTPVNIESDATRPPKGRKTGHFCRFFECFCTVVQVTGIGATRYKP
jgi:hypothetical protein